MAFSWNQKLYEEILAQFKPPLPSARCCRITDSRYQALWRSVEEIYYEHPWGPYKGSKDELKKDFGKGAFTFLIVENMSAQDVSKLKAKIEQVDHVDTALWYDSFLDVSVPMEILPDKLYDAFNAENSTMMAIFFDTGTSEDETLNAVEEIRSIAGEQCFLSGMTAMVVDLKDLCEREEPIYVAIAVVLALAVMMLFLDS